MIDDHTEYTEVVADRHAVSSRHDKVGGKTWWTWAVDRRRQQRKIALQQSKLDRLELLGIHPDGLAGRLRLVLAVGCYSDFRFTRDILSSGAKQEQTELAIEALMDLGALCDCEVFKALGQLPRSVLWHHPVVSVSR
ncbi:MAG TPA: DUF2695 domain-containing protein [Chloroflexia bacterium]|jgi:hypothetical protein